MDRAAGRGRLPGWKLSIARDSRRGCLPAQETLAAVYWPALSWLEWYRGVPTALGAGSHRLRLAKARGRTALALCLAILAALGFVLEVFVVEEVLFSRCEYKVCSAVNAFEDSVLKLRHSSCAPYQPELLRIRRRGLRPATRLLDLPA